MAFVTKIRLEGAGTDPNEIKSVFDDTCAAIVDHLRNGGNDQLASERITDEVYERSDGPHIGTGWFKGRRVVWYVQPGGPNDPAREKI